jgi:hypothetical protein
MNLFSWKSAANLVSSTTLEPCGGSMHSTTYQLNWVLICVHRHLQCWFFTELCVQMHLHFWLSDRSSSLSQVLPSKLLCHLSKMQQSMHIRRSSLVNSSAPAHSSELYASQGQSLLSHPIIRGLLFPLSYSYCFICALLSMPTETGWIDSLLTVLHVCTWHQVSPSTDRELDYATHRRFTHRCQRGRLLACKLSESFLVANEIKLQLTACALYSETCWFWTLIFSFLFLNIELTCCINVATYVLLGCPCQFA